MPFSPGSFTLPDNMNSGVAGSFIGHLAACGPCAINDDLSEFTGSSAETVETAQLAPGAKSTAAEAKERA